MRRFRFRLTPLSLLLTLVVVCCGAVAADKETPEPASGGSFAWHENAKGFELALDEALETETPLAVYFYTDWCGYCRQLEREVLYRAETEDYMRHVTKVRINPEKGQTENQIAQRYGVYGFPSFYFHAGPGHEAKRLSGRVKRDGEWQMQTPEEFVETMQSLVDGGK